MKTAEEWKTILDAPIYQVSNHGRVRNKRRDAILLPRIINGSVAVNIHSETRYVARLVYEAFVDEDLGRRRLVHIDGNNMNNTPDNLEVRGVSGRGSRS